MLSQPFVPFLDATLVLDEPRTVKYLVPSQLEKWRVGEEEAFMVAMRNAAEVSRSPLELYASTNGPLWHVPGEDVYATSRLLVPGWLESMKDRVEGRPLAIIPERSMLFVGGDARSELVRWLAESAQREHAATTRSISPTVYTVDDLGNIIPYLPAGTDELANLIKLGHAKLLAQTYEDQKSLLDPFHEKTGVDVYVASVELVVLEDGRPLSWCTWGDGIETLLPKTDVVAVGSSTDGDGKWAAWVPFEAARAIAGPLWTTAKVTVGPERIRASGAMSPEQKAAFQKASRPFAACI